MIVSLLSAALGAATLAGATVAVLRGIYVPGSQLLAPSIAQVPNRYRQIALTFNDGPSESTPALLELLERHRVRATFFVCGKNVKRLPHIAQAIVEAGHELGNHSHRHISLCPRPGADLKPLSSSEMLREMRKAQTCIHHHTGAWPRYFRAPYGLRWFGMRTAQHKLGVQGITCSVRSPGEDWPHDRIASHLLRQTEPGAIVSLRDGRGLCAEPDIRETLRALNDVLPIWKARGLRIGTVHDLMRAGARKRRSSRSDHAAADALAPRSNCATSPTSATSAH